MKTILLITIILSFTACGSIKFEENPPFTITSATYNNWVGGQPGISGTKLEFHLAEKTTVAFDSVFFKNNVTKAEVTTKKGKTIVLGHFNTSARSKDLILDKNSTKELKNKLPKNKKLPFELEEGEAVLSYKEANKTKYIKVTSLKKVQTIYYPKAK